MIEIACKQCGHTMRVPDAYAGKKGKCPHCGGILFIPSGSPPRDPEAAGAIRGNATSEDTSSGHTIGKETTPLATRPEPTSRTMPDKEGLIGICPVCGKRIRITSDSSSGVMVCPYCQSRLRLRVPAKQLPGAPAAPSGGGADTAEAFPEMNATPVGSTNPPSVPASLMFCSECGQPISRSASACPRCGAPVKSSLQQLATAPGTQPQPAPRPYRQVGRSYSGTATAGFVCSLVGVFCLGLILGLIGLILSASALSGMSRTGNRDGQGLATAGVILGIIDLAGWALLLVFWLGPP